MEDYPSNSHKAKDAKDALPEKKIEKIVEGKVVRKKRSLAKRFAETFFSGDIDSVRNNVQDVLISAARDAISDAITTGMERMLFGETRPKRRSSSRPSGMAGGYTNYSRYARPERDRRDESRGVSRRARGMHEFDEIILATRVEAENVLDKMFDIIENYGHVTVRDFYSMVGVTPEFTDEKYGWVELRGAYVSRSSDGYLMNLPKPEPLTTN